MKYIIITTIAGLCVLASVQAQLINQESLTGAALGAGAGAIIGNQFHGQSGEGAAIGAAAGYLLGQGVHRQRQYQNAQAYPAQSGAYYPYNNYPYYGQPAYAPYPSYAGPAPYPYQRKRPNYAITGGLLGAGAGAIIGNQHHGQSGEGALIGAAAGLILGGLAERNARKREQEATARWYASQRPIEPQPIAEAPRATQPQQLAPPVPVNSPPTSSLQEANKLFGR